MNICKLAGAEPRKPEPEITIMLGNPPMQPSSAGEFMTAAEVTQRFGINISTLYRWIRDYGFPKGVALTPKCVRWRPAAVQTWVDSRERDAA